MAPTSGQSNQGGMHTTIEACMHSEGIVCTSHVVWLNNASLRYTQHSSCHLLQRSANGRQRWGEHANHPVDSSPLFDRGFGTHAISKPQK